MFRAELLYATPKGKKNEIWKSKGRKQRKQKQKTEKERDSHAKMIVFQHRPSERARTGATFVCSHFLV